MQTAFQEIVLQLALSGLVVALVAIPLCAAFRRLRTQCRALNAWNFALAAVFLFVACAFRRLFYLRCIGIIGQKTSESIADHRDVVLVYHVVCRCFILPVLELLGGGV